MNYNYFASPYNSPRAMSFREAYGNANPGEQFMFEGQPYAGPPRPSTPPGGWTGGINPYELADRNQMQEVGPSDGGMGQPQDINSDYYARNYFREFPVGLDGNPVYGATPGIPPPSEGKGAMFDMEGNLIFPNSGGTRLPFDDPSIAGTRIPFPEMSDRQLASALNRVDDPSSPRFGAANQMGVAQIQHNPPSSVTGMYGPGQDTGPLSGLLSGPMVNRTQSGLLADNSNTNKSGWEKDKPFNAALAQMIMQWGMNQATDDEF